ncbi:MAG: bifunctional aldolase/short-chain dehydrogenase [Acidobacteriota bacterium]
MKNRWSDEDAGKFLSQCGPDWGEDLALRTYTARLLGAEKGLVLHGGGNTSVKAGAVDILGDSLPTLYVKASGYDLASIAPEGHPGLDLERLKRLRQLPRLSDEDMLRQIRSALLNYQAPTPSVETLVHAFLPMKFIDHTHAEAILALTNQPHGRDLIREALAEDVITLDYFESGFELARAAAEALESSPDIAGMVWLKHGLVTWGETARHSYEATIELVTRAEEYLDRKASVPLKVLRSTELDKARRRWLRAAPILRGLLAEPSGNEDLPYRRVILRPLMSRQVLDFLDSERSRELALSPPLTADYLIRSGPFPLWIDSPVYDDPAALREQVGQAIADYHASYRAYIERNSSGSSPGAGSPGAGSPEAGSPGAGRFHSSPRVILMPGLGAVCVGEDVRAADICRDITMQDLEVKSRIGAMGSYEGLSESHLFAMEYWGLQQAKLMRDELPLRRRVALVTGAAGAIGSRICTLLLENGCHVAVTDLPGEHLDSFTADLESRFGPRALGVPLDVTDPESVMQALEAIILNWGGLDVAVINAGAALVSSLEEMDLEAFRRLEKINLDGTLNILSEAARHFRTQATGGDVVLISTKNVFSPGAKFGAYSATKAAAHQLARIASMELAEMDVRVNMVAPDAIFGEGARKSGLWAEVGPERMRARGLDEKGLEDYYRNRNLLKARITATHVARAVLFFVTRQTPTTGATLPVDGGLPDATPR